jgi:hypothetical protein
MLLLISIQVLQYPPTMVTKPAVILRQTNPGVLVYPSVSLVVGVAPDRNCPPQPDPDAEVLFKEGDEEIPDDDMDVEKIQMIDVSVEATPCAEGTRG